jgi:hypothetical protein
MNNNHRIVNVTIKNIFDVINHRVITIIIGKLKNIMKLNITLKFRNNIKKYNLTVLFKFSIVILDETHIDSNTFLFSNIIAYFEYENSIFRNIQTNNNIIKK